MIRSLLACSYEKSPVQKLARMLGFQESFPKVYRPPSIMHCRPCWNEEYNISYNCKGAANKNHRTSCFDSIGQESSADHSDEPDRIGWSREQLGGCDIGVPKSFDNSWEEK